MDLRCPHCGQASTDAEFCSECGAAMVPRPPVAVPAPPAPDPVQTVAGEACPVCGELRPGPLARFCDTCRYDFVTHQPFGAAPAPAAGLAAPPTAQPASDPAHGASVPPPSIAPPPASPSLASDRGAPHGPAAPPSTLPAPAPPAHPRRWELLAQVDTSLRKLDDPEPSDRSERLFPLDLQDHLIGRRSDSADIHPEVVVPDPGISRRHARILRQPDGGLALVDLGSMNGTRLNGAPVAPNVITPLAEGDQVTVGCWTRLTVRER